MLDCQRSSAGAARRGKLVWLVKVCATAWFAAAALILCLDTSAEAKTPGTIHCYGGWCHRINSIDEMDGMVGRRGVLKASYYDDCRRDRFNPCGLTSSGAIFRPDQPDNAASPIFPDGTIILTFNPDTGLAAVVRITSTGPYRGDRTLDVSRATAQHLGFAKRGVASLEVAVLKSPAEHDARYLKLRNYEPVPGFIGRFTTFENAQDAAIAKLRMEQAGVTVAAVDVRAEIERFWPKGLAQDLREKISEDMAPLPEVALLPSAAIAMIEIHGPAQGETVTARTVEEAGLEMPFRVAALASDNLKMGHLKMGQEQSLINGISSLVARARQMAQPQLLASFKDPQVNGAIEDNLTLAEWAKSFIRAAQVRARIGAGASGAISEALAAE